jgi:drug/metabolite transporter superfamily protein YnfA
MFEVVQVRRAMDGKYNEAWVRRTEAPDLEAIRLAAGAIAGAFGAFLSGESPVNTVIITALAYKDEISRDLRERYGFAGKIACLSGGAIIELEPDRSAPS